MNQTLDTQTILISRINSLVVLVFLWHLLKNIKNIYIKKNIEYCQRYPLKWSKPKSILLFTLFTLFALLFSGNPSLPV